MFNTLFICKEETGSITSYDDIFVYYASRNEDTVTILKEKPIDAVIFDKSGEGPQKNEVLDWIRKSYLPVSIVEFNGNSKIEVVEYFSGLGTVHIHAPKDESSLSQSLHLMKKHRQLLLKNFRKKFTTLRNTLIESFLQSLRIRDSVTYEHSLRLEILCEAFGRYIGLSDDEIILLRASALMHDIGKIGILDSVLNKTNKLNHVEYEIMKSHIELGTQVLDRFEDLKIIVPIMRHHHEKFDGSGYPDGLASTGIPYLSRILSICDSYDSLTSQRVYRNKRHFHFALEVLRSDLKEAFDPELQKQFENFISDSEILVKIYHRM